MHEISDRETTWNVLWHMKSWKKCGIYIYNEILCSIKKGSPVICGNMDELEGYYAKWNISYFLKLKDLGILAGFLDSSSYSHGGVDRMALVFMYVYICLCAYEWYERNKEKNEGRCGKHRSTNLNSL